jgi:5-methylcytosine-specific restriction endonuclease McrA
MWKLQQNPLCELCQAEGFVRSAIDVHHKVPVESARTPQEMEQLCFNPSNLQALCISCHADIHRNAKSHTKEAHKQRERDRLERWKAELERRVADIQAKKPTDQNPGGVI